MAYFAPSSESSSAPISVEELYEAMDMASVSPEKTTLQVLIRKFVVQGDITDLIGFSNMMNKTELANVNYNSLKSAAIVVGVAPILLIYPFALKFYAKDVMEGGVKE